MRSGAIDWSCVSTGRQTATDRGLYVADGATATLPAKYAPSECR
jgi:hypothetical protein